MLVSARLRSEGGGLVVRGRAPAGPWEARVSVPAAQPGSGDPAVTALYAREIVEDLETDLAAGAPAPEIDPAVEKLGLEFGIATRLTSWVAISEEPSVDPRQPARRVRMPQELPYGMSAEGLGLRPSLGGELRMMTATQYLSTFPDPSGLRSPQLSTRRRMLDSVAEVGRRTEKRLPDVPEPPQPREFPPTMFQGFWFGPAPAGVCVLVFEVEGAPLDWNPGANAILHLTGRGLLQVPVEIKESTLVGIIEPGCLVRLALRIDEATRRETTAVLVTTAGRIIRIAT